MDFYAETLLPEDPIVEWDRVEVVALYAAEWGVKWFEGNLPEAELGRVDA